MKTGSLLITAGPTHEPIDAVRYIGNRSSGRLGIALADEAARRGWTTTLLLGPTPAQPGAGYETRRFTSTADLQALLQKEFPACDVLIMAAAVADYRPATVASVGKIRRDPGGVSLHLEPTPDLLAGCAAARRPGQLLIGFALEPPERLLASAREKIARKHIDAIVANPLRTMDAPDIEATFIRRDGSSEPTPGPIAKTEFAPWLLDRIQQLCEE